MSVIKKWRMNLLDILFPHLCLGCHSYLENRLAALCQNCRDKISISSAFCCSNCGRRLPTTGGNIKKCSCEHSFIVGLAINYESQPARELIKGLKYSGITAAANELAEFLADFIKNSGLNLKNFYILPIPLSKKRMRERGFNQSELIARNFAKFLGIPSVAIISNAMLRVKHTRQQTKMPDYKERLENVAKCFSVIKEEEIKGRQFIIIDDVFTSGATSAEAVKTLKLAGARKIIVLCAAKA